MKLAVFDGSQGLVALLDPVITRPSWTAVVFDHAGFGEAMRALFEQWWAKGADSEVRCRIDAAEAPDAGCRQR